MERSELTSELHPLPLIGRDHELSELERALESLTSGHGGVVVIEGEPGVGKSRLALEFATRARQRDVRVLWAACDMGAESAPALWPWVQIAHRLSLSGKEIESGAKAIQNGLRTDSAVPMLTNPPSGQYDARILPIAQVSRAAIGLLAETGREKPLALVFEDAERTDALSLDLIAAAAAELREILIVISCYAGALRQSAALRKTFSNPVFNRARWIQLKRFDDDELMRFVETRAQFTPDASALDAIKRLSGGNPEFLETLLGSESARNQHDPLKGGAITARARIAVERYLRAFPEDVRAVLRVAAMIGSEFELRVLDQVCAESHAQVGEIVDEAEAAGIIKPLYDRPGSYTFAHLLVRDALRDETPRRESVRLHRQIGLALLNLHTFEREYLSDIAAHLFHGAPEDRKDPRPAQYCERAAENAERARDYRDAARFYRMALATLDPNASEASSRRCDLLLALGRVERRAGDIEAGTRDLACAAELAELNHDPVRFARAALAMAGGVWHIALGGQDAPRIKSSLEKSLLMLGDRTVPETAMVLARLAAELYSRGETPERQSALAAQADAIARSSGDPEALLAVLQQRHLVLLGDRERRGECLSNADEMLAIASTLGSDEQWCLAFALRQAELVRIGDLIRADAAAAALSNAVRTGGSAVCAEALAIWTAMRAFIDGRFEEALSGARRLLDWLERIFPEAIAFCAPGIAAMLRELGRPDEIEGVVTRGAEDFPWLRILRASLAQIRLGLGDEESARSMLRALLAQGVSNLTASAQLPIYAAALTELSAQLGESSHADELYEILLPHETHNIVFGPFGFAGPAARYLGMLAAMRGKFADAEEHFRRALRLSSQTMARPWIAYTEVEYAEMLLARGESGDRELAATLIKSGQKTASMLKMNRLASYAEALKSRLAAGLASPNRNGGPHQAVNRAELPDNLTLNGEAASREQRTLSAPAAAHDGDSQSDQVPAESHNLFKREGDYWTIIFAKKIIRLRHAKGLSMIAWLLRHPHHEFLAWTLDRLASGHEMTPGRGEFSAQFDGELTCLSGTSDGGPLLDPQATAEYGRHLKELQEELSEAKSFNDIGRISAIEEEIRFITSELCRGIGLGGRPRKWPSATERARVNVTNAVRTVLARIRRENPALARYLANTVKTGRFCTFDPDPSLPAEWIL